MQLGRNILLSGQGPVERSWRPYSCKQWSMFNTSWNQVLNTEQISSDLRFVRVRQNKPFQCTTGISEVNDTCD
jgi:hypothetical protein